MAHLMLHVDRFVICRVKTIMSSMGGGGFIEIIELNGFEYLPENGIDKIVDQSNCAWQIISTLNLISCFSLQRTTEHTVGSVSMNVRLLLIRLRQS